MDYEGLKTSYCRAKGICDPIDYVQRQRDLSYAIAAYLLERDKPPEEVKEMPLIKSTSKKCRLK